MFFSNSDHMQLNELILAVRQQSVNIQLGGGGGGGEL